MRPGLAAGRYPQRAPERRTKLEQFAAVPASWLARARAARRYRARQFVARVGRFEAEFARATASDLDDRLVPMTAQLRRHGLDSDAVPQGFAVIRELAHRHIGLRPYACQLAGGAVMLRGEIAEMETGEGKSLTACLPAGVAGLAGIPVHVITVNDYLAQRDAVAFGPLYRALGLSVGIVLEGQTPDERRAAYACDVTYCTNKHLAFDYLRDRMRLRDDPSDLRLELEGLHTPIPRTNTLLLRGLCFGIVDEADSVLIDEARTPLVISRDGGVGEDTPVYTEALRIARALDQRTHYVLDTEERKATLTAAGRQRAEADTVPMGGVWTGARRREALLSQALAALHLFVRDRDYLLADSGVQIIDEYTGRVMPDRAWQRGIHQLVELKEGCKPTAQRETLARISYQRFFRRYLRLAGMTGTAREVAGELWQVYELKVTRVPTHRPLVRRGQGAKVYRTAKMRWNVVEQSVRKQQANGRPVLVGTRSVDASEHFGQRLEAAGIDHRLLNARQDNAEADTIAGAGEAMRVTVATNMAGRGTDIVLAPPVRERGGLHVIATEHHDSRRIDRQLFGRCGRQGDPGTFEAIVALDDALFTDHLPAWCLWLAAAAGRGDQPLVSWLGHLLVRRAQQAAERSHARARRNLMKLDEHVGDMLAFSGSIE